MLLPQTFGDCLGELGDTLGYIPVVGVYLALSSLRLHTYRVDSCSICDRSGSTTWISVVCQVRQNRYTLRHSGSRHGGRIVLAVTEPAPYLFMSRT